MLTSRTTHRGVSIVDTLATIIVAVLLIAITVTAVYGIGERNADDRAVNQLRLIHQAFQQSGQAFDDRLLRPGLLRRQPVRMGDGRMVHIPGQGAEDQTQNTTANLYSAMIMQAYFDTDIVVAPNDPNPRVRVLKSYNFDRYNPHRNEYWDNKFKADLESESHASFAHLLLYGMRMRDYWRVSAVTTVPIFSTRGPRDGKNDPDSLTTDDEGNWSGHIMPHPKGKARIDTMTPDWLPPLLRSQHDEGESPDGDNLFAVDDGMTGRDVVLTFMKEVTDDGPVIQHD